MNKEKSFAVASRRERGFEKSEAKARLTLWALALASNPQKRNFIILDCYASLRFARNDSLEKVAHAVRGNDDFKVVDKFVKFVII